MGSNPIIALKSFFFQAKKQFLKLIAMHCEDHSTRFKDNLRQHFMHRSFPEPQA